MTNKKLKAIKKFGTQGSTQLLPAPYHNSSRKDENALNELFFALRIFFIWNRLFDFCFRIFISKTQKVLLDLLLQNVLFLILDFHFGCRENLPRST